MQNLFVRKCKSPAGEFQVVLREMLSEDTAVESDIVLTNFGYTNMNKFFKKAADLKKVLDLQEGKELELEMAFELLKMKKLYVLNVT